ncbi:MAG: arginyltransferase [Panacagrimonas sp.]
MNVRTVTERIRLYLSTEHPCGYLSNRMARSLFIDPDLPLDPGRYQALLEQGFRRGGDHVYRPRCGNCVACRPARIPVADHRCNRSQRRCLASNQDLQLRIVHHSTQEQFELYQRYLRARHQNAGMNPDDKSGFHSFLHCRWGQAEFWEFREQDTLLAVAVVDRLPDALSAVYTFFDPQQSARSLGTYAVLRQLEQARQQCLRHVYLGYWVAGSRKMDYKRRFRPLEVLGPRGWEALDGAA